MLNGLFQILDACKGLAPIVSFVKKGLFPLIQIGIPIILIIMGSIDLGKAVLSSDDKAIKAAQGALVKRCIAAVAVFFVVTIVNLIFSLFGNAGIEGEGKDQVSGANDWWTCWDSIK